MIWKPHVTVATVIERDGKFLMVEEEADGRRVFNQPAGHLEPGEGLQQAAIRETLEETGWHVQLTAITGIYQWQSPLNGITYLRTCFAAECKTHDEERALDTGILRALWMGRDELVTNSTALRSPMVLQCVDDYLAGRRFPLQLLTDLNHTDRRDD